MKESTRWVEKGARSWPIWAEQMSDTRLAYMADREGDVRTLMDEAARRGDPADWLVCAQHNRNTASGERLWDGLIQSEPLGKVEFTLEAAPARPARRVQQTLYGESVALLQPKSAPAVTVIVILAREEHPPTGKKAIEWRLLTNRTAETLEAVLELMDGYRRRWLIEIIFSESSNRVAASMRCSWAPWNGWNGRS